MVQIDNNNSKNPLKSFWRKDGCDFIADLAAMKKAIVVAWYIPSSSSSYYAISPRSYFPFTEEQIAVKYSDHQTCCIESEKIILGWMQSLINPEQKSDDSIIEIGIPNFPISLSDKQLCEFHEYVHSISHNNNPESK